MSKAVEGLLTGTLTTADGEVQFYCQGIRQPVPAVLIGGHYNNAENGVYFPGEHVPHLPLTK